MEEHNNLLVGLVYHHFRTGDMRFEALACRYAPLLANLLIGDHCLIDRQHRISKQIDRHRIPELGQSLSLN